MTIALVRDLMTPHVMTLSEDQSFVSAEQIMRLERVRHLPVVEGDRHLVGLVTHRDLIRAQAKLAQSGEERVTAGDVMSEALLTCSPDTPADDAARMMIDAKVGCILVVEGERLVGIVTESDVMQWAVEMMAKMRFDG